ncbi:MAG TPA: SDR family oxidoreductase [Solirubrobacterales bacterium]|nr:SDR family oxidoreductase [Solirubrobacterales bacterium]
MNESISLQGKTAIVTGAASGIGAATAALFAANGARVLAADIQEPNEMLAAKLESNPETIRFHHLDVTSEQAWADGLSVCADAFGSPNVLVNNAGRLGSGRPVHEETLEEMRVVFEVNTLGMMLGMKTVIPGMLEGDGGAIVNVSSVWGLSGTPNNVAYQTAKGATIMLSKNAGVTYAPHGIRVNCVLPGYVDTPMSRGVTPEEAVRLVEFTPLGRRAEPHEVAPLIMFLCSDGAGFVAAGTFTCDGGMAAL